MIPNTPLLIHFTNLFRVKTEIVNPKYFVYLLSSLYLNGITVRNVKQTTGIQNLDIYGFMTERFYYPQSQNKIHWLII